MKDKYRYSTSQLFNFAQNSYLERTSRPIYAVVFLLPFIVFYELGTILINTDLLKHYWQGRVVAFSWVQEFFVYIGLGSKFAWVATPLAVVVILMSLQLASRKSWRFRLGDVWPMVVECIFLAVPLIVLSMFLNGSVQHQDDIGQLVHTATSCSSVTNDGSPTMMEHNGDDGKWQGLVANIITGIGAGIYEELIFRLILICVLMLLFQDLLQFSHKNSIIFSVLASAALFSAHHHIVYLGGQFIQNSPFNLTEFVFRTIAGVYFAVLFAIRGFGITAGAHGFYDIITAVYIFFARQ